MPIEKKITNKYGTIGVWHLVETSGELLSLCKLNDEEKERLDTLRFERRRKEFLATRALLHAISEDNHTIRYTESGKPVLSNSDKHISISHSDDFVCIFTSKHPVGIDIERTDRKIDKIANRFLHPLEQEFIEKLPDPQFAKILFWGAKEAIFKCAPHEGIQFNTQILIPPFTLTEQENFHGQLDHPSQKQNYVLQYYSFKDNVLVLCVEKVGSQKSEVGSLKI